ncbi:MAG: cell division protein FtsZ [Bacteroidota bacterium]
MSLEFDFKKRNGSIIKVVGIGGGGGNAVANMYREGITGVDFAICNTDNQALENSPVEVRIQLGPHLTEGRGAGSKPEVGKQACLESVDHIKEFLDDGTKMVFVTAGMGGGTGTGAAPIVAKTAKDMGILTVAIVTLPFKFEGMRRQRFAIEGLEELKKQVDAYLVISNDRLFKMHPNLGLSEAFGEADSILTTAAKGIAEIITVWGNINVDFEDVNTVMRGSGVAIMGNAIATGEDRARTSISNAMSSPLLEDNDIRGARHILLNITSGKNEVTMQEIGEITEYVQEEAGYGTNLIWGSCRDESLGDAISVTLIATGFRTSHVAEATIEDEKVRIPLDESQEMSEENGIVFGFDDAADQHTIDFEEDDVRKTIQEMNQSAEYYAPQQRKEVRSIDGDTYQESTEKYQHMEKARRSYMRKNLSMSLDDPKMISDMENEPAYKRRNVSLDQSKDHTRRPSSGGLEIGTDEDNPLRRSNNTFLHDNVD